MTPDLSSAEKNRIFALNSYHLLDTLELPDYNELTELASLVCGTPIAGISIVDDTHQWFIAIKGLPEEKTERMSAFCNHVIQTPDEIFQVEDAREDERFKRNPVVTGAPNITFYAGVPLLSKEGYAIGSMCVIDSQPRKLSEQQRLALKALARQVMDKLELRKKNGELEKTNERLLYVQGELQSAVRQATLNQQRFQNLVRESTVGIIVLTGEKMRVEIVNHVYGQLVGRSEEELLGKDLFEVLPEAEAYFRPLVEQVRRTGESLYLYDTPYQVHGAGEMIEGYLNLVYQPYIENNQAISGVVVLCHDVTEQYRARQLAEYSYNQIHQMVMRSPMGMCILRGTQFVVEMANEPMYKLWTRRPEQILNRKLLEVFPELLGQPFPELLEGVLRSGKRVAIPEMTVNIAEPDGTLNQLYVDFTYDPLLDAAGKPDGIIVAVNDITEAVTARRLLEESRRRTDELNGALAAINEELTSAGEAQAAINEELSTVNEKLLAAREETAQAKEILDQAISSANLGTWYMNAATRKFIPSVRLKELFGYYPDEEMPYEAAIEQITADHREKVAQSVEDALTQDKAYDLEYPVIGYHDQQLRWVRATGSLFKSILTGQIHFSGTVADITERKLDEQRRSDFIGMVSHELRNPLTSMNGYVQMLQLKAQKSNDAAIAEIAEKAKRQVDRMKALITGFLDVARLGEGRLQLNRKCFDMAHLVKLAEEESLVTVTSHQIVYHPVEFTPVEADLDKIEQVLVNFINNAVKYSPNGTTINVACVTRDGRAHVSVTDEGMGISLKDQPYVFDRFYRVESEKMTKVKGFGIGLYICKEIIERHGGQIGVESVEGKGSTFWFSLPVHAGQS